MYGDYIEHNTKKHTQNMNEHHRYYNHYNYNSHHNHNYILDYDCNNAPNKVPEIREIPGNYNNNRCNYNNILTRQDNEHKDENKIDIIISTNNRVLSEHGKSVIDTIVKSIVEKEKNKSQNEKSIWVVSVEKTKNNGNKLVFGVCEEIDLVCNGFKKKLEIDSNIMINLNKHKNDSDYTNTFVNPTTNLNGLQNFNAHQGTVKYNNVNINLDKLNKLSGHATEKQDKNRDKKNKDENENENENNVYLKSNYNIKINTKISSYDPYGQKAIVPSVVSNSNSNSNCNFDDDDDDDAYVGIISMEENHDNPDCERRFDSDFNLVFQQILRWHKYKGVECMYPQAQEAEAFMCNCEEFVVTERVLQLLHKHKDANQSDIDTNNDDFETHLCKCCLITLHILAESRHVNKDKIINNDMAIFDIVTLIRNKVEELVNDYDGIYGTRFSNLLTKSNLNSNRLKFQCLEIINHGLLLLRCLANNNEYHMYIFEDKCRKKICDSYIIQALKMIFNNSQIQFKSLDGQEIVHNSLRLIVDLCKYDQKSSVSKSKFNFSRKADRITNDLFTMIQAPVNSDSNSNPNQIGYSDEMDVDLLKSILQIMKQEMNNYGSIQMHNCLRILHFMSTTQIGCKNNDNNDNNDNQIKPASVVMVEYGTMEIILLAMTQKSDRETVIKTKCIKVLIQLTIINPHNVIHLIQQRLFYQIFALFDEFVRLNSVKKKYELIETSLHLLEEISKQVFYIGQNINNNNIMFGKNNCKDRSRIIEYISDSIEFEKKVYKNTIEPIFIYYHELYTTRIIEYEQQPDHPMGKLIVKYGSMIVPLACQTLCKLINCSSRIGLSFEKDHYNPSIMNDILSSHLNKFNQIFQLSLSSSSLSATNSNDDEYLDMVRVHKKLTMNPDFRNNLINVYKCVKQCEWKHIIRYIWIGFYKNNNNKHCYIDLLPKDIVKHLIIYLVNDRVDDMIKVWSNTMVRLR